MATELFENNLRAGLKGEKALRALIAKIRPEFHKVVRRVNRNNRVTDIQTAVGCIEVKSKTGRKPIYGDVHDGKFIPRNISYIRWSQLDTGVQH